MLEKNAVVSLYVHILESSESMTIAEIFRGTSYVNLRFHAREFIWNTFVKTFRIPRTPCTSCTSVQTSCMFGSEGGNRTGGDEDRGNGPLPVEPDVLRLRHSEVSRRTESRETETVGRNQGVSGRIGEE